MPRAPRISPRRVVDRWLDPLRRAGSVPRETVVVGLFILDSLREWCPVVPSEAVSASGKIVGADAGWHALAAKYGLAAPDIGQISWQAHEAGQRLLQELDYGNVFAGLGPEARDAILLEGIDLLLDEARAWLARQNLKVLCSRQASPAAWLKSILDEAQGRSGGRVEQHLVGAKLSRAHPNIEIPVHPGTAADAQTGRAGDFQVGTTVYHVTAAPGEAVVRKAVSNYRSGLHPVLLVPAKDRERATLLVDLQKMAGLITVLAIEDFFSVNILEMSQGERGDFLKTLLRIIEEYNRRVDQAETDKSLRIDVE